MTPVVFAAIVLSCLLLSAFFSASETALLRLRLEELDGDVKAAKGPAAVAARNLLNSTSRLLVTILLGNNIVNSLLATCASVLFVHLFGERTGVILSTVFTTFVVLVFGEVLPKALGAAHPKRISYLVALPLYLVHHSLFLVHWAFDKFLDPLVKRLSMSDAERIDSTEEVLRLARTLRQGKGQSSPTRIIAATADAVNMTVSEIMVPRTEIIAFPAHTPAEALLDQLVDEGHTRAPIYDQSLDRILGLVHVKDLIKFVRRKGKDVREIIKPVLRVPERKPILRLLEDMQRGFAHMAVVKDEFGVTMGLITQEDILEEIVGEIRDEFDKEELETIQRMPDGSFEVLGRILVLDFNRETGWDVLAERGDTLSGLVFNHLGRAPKEGDKVQIGDYDLRVAGVSGTRITRVRISQHPAPEVQN